MELNTRFFKQQAADPELQKLEGVLARLDEVLLDKARVLRLALSCLLARGHLLIEDVPGVGKTTLALALARLMGLDFVRVQMTSDLLPGDLLGVSIFDPTQHQFRFHPGPLFHSLVLVDEINRAPARTQSALLEAMAEGQISVDGNSYVLPTPFFVMATQNPIEQLGVFPLPESQLDRFLMRIEIGYPSRAAQQRLLQGAGEPPPLSALLDREGLLNLQARCQAVFLSDEIVEMLLGLTEASRQDKRIQLGLSPRGMLALKAAAQAWAVLAGRDFVVPADVYAVSCAVLGHRILGKPGAPSGQELCGMLMEELWGYPSTDGM